MSEYAKLETERQSLTRRIELRKQMRKGYRDLVIRRHAIILKQLAYERPVKAGSQRPDHGRV